VPSPRHVSCRATRRSAHLQSAAFQGLPP
jgi:hypothetical protein